MGFADWFTMKSARQREIEQKKYARWAYPYGEPQKEKLLSIMKELLPEEKGKMVMAIYLLGKEGYVGSYAEDREFMPERTQQEKIARAVVKMNPFLTGRMRPRMYRYLALIMADTQVDESLNYPTVEQLRRQAEELEKTGVLD